MNNRFLRYVAPLFLAFPMVISPSGSGCVDDASTLESLTITDASAGCNSSSSPTPYALGSRVDLNVHGPEGWVEAPEATLDTQDVWSLLDSSPEGVSLTLQALKTGTAALMVRDGAGHTGRVALEVAPIATAEVTPWRDMQPFNFDVSLSPGPIEAETVASQGYGLLPDTDLVLQVTLRDVDGRVLGGYGAANWALSEQTDGTTLVPVAGSTDDVRLRHDGQNFGAVTITCAGGGSFTVQRSAKGSAASLEVIHVETGQRGTSISLREGEPATLVALVYDAQGRLLIGDDGDRLAIELNNDGVITVVPPPWSEGEDSIDLTPEIEEQLLDARAFYALGALEGSTTLTIRVAGLTAEFPVTVAPAE